ncbi:MAG: choice-of-anchor D domain-containing protein [Myxococcales bacterium]|nr:choice-of-anchor D domain-containing protein [Myxococcales bacterium]MCB9545050.1 choice-of-anchor D domain-containing protein [Myxococcales bacterium]
MNQITGCRSLTGRSNWLQLLLVGALVALGSAACDDDGGGGVRTAASPTIRVDPSEMLFPKVAPGSSAERQVDVSNTGSGELIIANIDFNVAANRGYELYWSRPAAGESDGGVDQLVGYTSDLQDRFPYPLRIQPGQVMTLVVVYNALDDNPTDGTITIESNDRATPTATIRIRQSDVGAEINVSPRTVDFGRVPATMEAFEDVTVANIGQVTLNIDQILLNGSQDFTPLINNMDPRRQPEALDDPDQDGEPGLGPDKRFTIRVRYSPLVEGPDRGEMSIFSDDPASPEVKVSLVANGATPCMNVTPPALEFRTSLVNRTDSRPLSIESCGGEQLEITRIYMAEDSDPAFELDVESVPELPALLPAADPAAAPPSRAIRVQFTPREQRIYNGKLIIESNDPVTPRREVSLLGRGVLNACPQARALQDEFYVVPLDVVTLDGSASIDQDGPNNLPVEYEWVVVSRPDGSVSQPVENFFNNQSPADGGPRDDTMTPTSLFFVDLAGTYVVELRVRDNLGLDSIACDNPAVVTIVARPEEAIHVQLVWDTPNDPDQTDAGGADLDLHLLHPNAENWFSAPYDCHYANPVPDWGQLENPADDPSLDIDDINGAGPENVNLDLPENTDVLGAPYLVGVHYYNSSDRLTGFDYGPSFATVRVFINGELSWDGRDDLENGRREMEAEDHFWDVVQITWPDGNVTTRNRYYNQRP